jgi:hypothetical protein
MTHLTIAKALATIAIFASVGGLLLLRAHLQRKETQRSHGKIDTSA